MTGYVVRNKEGIYSLHRENGDIIENKLTERGWGQNITLARDTQRDYSLLYYSEGEPRVLYKDREGNIMLSGKEPKTMLKNVDRLSSILHIYGIRNKDTLMLLYNKSRGTESYITEQHTLKVGGWSDANIIDKYISDVKMTKIVYQNGNYILFYIKKVPEYQIGYREIHPTGLREFKLLYSSGYTIEDYSLAVTEEEIHLCAIISTMRCKKLVYVKKTSSGLTSPKVLYEGNLEMCHISIDKNKVNIVFNTQRGSCEIQSQDMGSSFKKYHSTGNTKFNKTILADYIKQVPDEYVATEVIREPSYPYNIVKCPFVQNDYEAEIQRLKNEIERLKNIAK